MRLNIGHIKGQELERPMPSAIVRNLERRAAQEAVDAAVAVLDLNFEQLADTLQVDRRTVYRYRKRQTVPTPEVRRRFDMLREIIQLLEEIFAKPEDRHEWMYRSVPLLRGRRPIDLMLKAELEPIVEVLAGYQAGAHT